MQVLIVNQDEVGELLPMNQCIEVMADALKALSAGQAVNPLRPTLNLPSEGALLSLMPAYLGGEIQALGAKVISVFPNNAGTGLDLHQGAVLLFETRHGRLLSILDATAITAVRTAAVSGLATRLLARPEAADLAILGAGVQARAHLKAMRLVRPIRHVRVWSLPLDQAQRFTKRESRGLDVSVEVTPTAREAVEGAEIICTCTSARDPILMGEWIAPGTHVNAVGSSIPTARELDTAAVVMSRLYVDRRESTLNEAGDFLFPRQEGAIGDGHIVGEIGEILLGKVEGRRSPEEITLFKSLGLGTEDVAAAAYIFARAVTKGAGVWVGFGGGRPVAD